MNSQQTSSGSNDATADERAGLPRESNAPRRTPLHTKILVGLLLGVACGLTANTLATSGVGNDRDGNGLADWLDWAVYLAEPVGSVFLRLMFMVVLPLVFSALALAVFEIGDLNRLGRIGLRTLFLTAILSTAAVLLGVNLVNLVQPGQSLSQAQSERLRTRYGEKARTSVEKAKLRKDLRTTVVDLLPENPLQEMVGALDGSSKGNGMLAVMVFALIFGAGAAASPQACQTVVRALQGLYAISMTVIGFAMQIAPLGAGCLVFSLTAQLGLEILETLLWFVVAAIAGLAIQEFIVYSLVVRFLGGMSPGRFFRSISEAMLVALGTSSSNATLPTAMRVAETNLGLPRRVANFVLTVGATGNQNGTALFEGVVVLFLAQAMRIELTLAQQFTVVLMAVLAGVGTAGVPGGSLPMIVVVMTSVGIPGEAIGMVLGVDRLLDMCRTVVNVSGDLVIATCVAHSERCANPVAGSDTA